MLSIPQLGNAIRSYPCFESVISPGSTHIAYTCLKQYYSGASIVGTIAETLLWDNRSGNTENTLRKLHCIHFFAERGGIGILRIQFNDKGFNLIYIGLSHLGLRH